MKLMVIFVSLVLLSEFFAGSRWTVECLNT